MLSGDNLSVGQLTGPDQNAGRIAFEGIDNIGNTGFGQSLREPINLAVIAYTENNPITHS